MHLMVQPDSAIWFSDRLLLYQGLMSRVLVTAPDAASGTRLWKTPKPDSDGIVKGYGARLLKILEQRPPLVEGTYNELAPRTVSLSVHAQKLWIAFHDHIEQRLGVGRELDPVRGLANKLPEHAARIAAVLTLANDIAASEVGTDEMRASIELTQHYAAEAMRLFSAGRVSADLREAEQLRVWLLTPGPNATYRSRTSISAGRAQSVTRRVLTAPSPYWPTTDGLFMRLPARLTGSSP